MPRAGVDRDKGIRCEIILGLGCWFVSCCSDFISPGGDMQIKPSEPDGDSGSFFCEVVSGSFITYFDALIS